MAERIAQEPTQVHGIMFVRDHAAERTYAQCPCGWRFNGPRAELIHVCADHLRNTLTIHAAAS